MPAQWGQPDGDGPVSRRKTKANRQREYAKGLIAKYGSLACPNCGALSAHFVPSSLGEPGFFLCDTEAPEPVRPAVCADVVVP